MTIRDMEWKSGLERTNIRFYEREGLLTPERRDNGYRDYSEEDLQLLLKIKLLRRLGFSLEAIRSLKEGNTALDEALAGRLAAISGQRRELDAAEQVCTEMRQDGAAFPTLDAQRYLSTYDQALRAPNNLPPSVPETDRIEPVRCPWRRYFARVMDLSLATLILYLLFALVFRVNMSNLSSFVSWIFALLGWFLLAPTEALLLSRWGTTPGKWLLGIRLEHADGRLLTFEEAFLRAGTAFLKGEGLTIPFYELYRLWKSYKAVSDGDGAEWDEDVTIIVSDLRWWHPTRYIAAELLRSVVLGVFVILLPMLPVHRGDLTVKEFVENYNRQAKYFDCDDMILQTDGTFVSKYANNSGQMIIVDLNKMNDNEPLVLQFKEENGILTEISYEREMFNPFYGLYADSEGKTAAFMSIVSFAWSDATLLTPIGSQGIINELSSFTKGSLEKDICGCRMVYTAEKTGETLAPSGAYTGENYTFTFRLSRLPEAS